MLETKTKTNTNTISASSTDQASEQTPETAEALRRGLWQAWLRSLLLFCSVSVYVELCLHLCVYHSLDRRVAYLILFPVYWLFISSITPSGELFKTPIDYLPDHTTLESYKFLIQNVGLLSKIGNTVLIVGITLVISTVLCAMAAYGFSRFNSKGVSVAFSFVLATMLIP